MRIAVLGANTTTGQKIVKEAEKAGIKVTSLVSTFNDVVGNGKLIVKSFDELVFSDIVDCNYIVDTVSFFNISKYSSELLPVWHLLELLKNSKIKLLELGSSAFLYTDRKKSKFVFDQDSVIIDDNQSKIDRLCVNAFIRLSACTNVEWSCLCPPLLLDDIIYGCGKFEFSDNILPVGIQGDSFISLNDYVLACIELLKISPKKHECISVRTIRD